MRQYPPYSVGGVSAPAAELACQPVPLPDAGVEPQCDDRVLARFDGDRGALGCVRGCAGEGFGAYDVVAGWECDGEVAVGVAVDGGDDGAAGVEDRQVRGDGPVGAGRFGA